MVYFYRYDLRKYAKTEKYEKGAGTVQINRKVSDMLERKDCCRVTKADVSFTNLIAQRMIGLFSRTDCIIND
jgi:hypothetical protein